MKVSFIQIEGMRIPPFWYGLSYIDYPKRQNVYHIIPLNLVIRGARMLLFWWNRLRSRPTWIDKQVAISLDEIRDTERAAYDRRLEYEIKLLVKATKIVEASEEE